MKPGKSSLLPSKRLLQRLNTRNEFLISNHRPLRETLIAQTGDLPGIRADFLKAQHGSAQDRLIHTWEPSPALHALRPAVDKFPRRRAVQSRLFGSPAPSIAAILEAELARTDRA
jgi:hypothetical protein